MNCWTRQHQSLNEMEWVQMKRLLVAIQQRLWQMHVRVQIAAAAMALEVAHHCRSKESHMPLELMIELRCQQGETAHQESLRRLSNNIPWLPISVTNLSRRNAATNEQPLVWNLLAAGGLGRCDY